jgi:predicted methyltransferase
MQVVLSYLQAEVLLEAYTKGVACVLVSPDLGRMTTEARLDSDGVHFPGGQLLNWDEVKEIESTRNSCYLLEPAAPRKIQVFSTKTNRLYSLMPTPSAPTMLIAGFPMHRIKGTDPQRDTREKIRTIQPLVGEVLDTATGLGYTAIEAARTAEHVLTVELDPAALEVARLNPWSQELFDNSKISQTIGDSFEVVTELEDERFSRIIHDPPAFSLDGDLYSSEIYSHLYRILRPNGRLFHYIGNPESRSGRNITAGVIRRLDTVGFKRIKRTPRAFGVVATRG